MWVNLSGINWASLLYASQLLLQLSILATGLYVGLMLVLDAVGIWKRPKGSNSFPGTSKLYALVQRAKRQVTKWAPRVAMFIIGFVLGQAGLFSPVRELHNVEVLRKDGDRVYSVHIPAQMSRAAMTGPIRLCAEGDDLPLVPGMVMKRFQYIQESDCMLVNGNTNVQYLRDADDNVIDKGGNQLFARR